jgi:5-methylcytosine-specific restriction endonuclease McrA
MPGRCRRMSQVAPVLHREPVQIEKRRPLTRRELIQLMLDQNGKCGCGCGSRLDPIDEGVIDEHVLPLSLGGTNALTNRQLWRKPCAKAKTRRDEADDAKANRLLKKADPEQRKPPQIQSRGFQKTVSRGFDGKVRPRRNSTAKEGA